MSADASAARAAPPGGRSRGWWRDAPLVAFVFLLYTNIPVLVGQAFGLPMAVGGSHFLLLLLPLVAMLLQRERLKANTVFLLMLLFLAVLLASALRVRHLDIAAARIGTYLVEGIILYWLVLNVVHCMSRVRRVIWTLLAAGALLGGLATWQAVSGSTYEFGGLAARDHEMIEKAEREGITSGARPLERYRGADRAEGPVDEPNRYAQLMIVLLPLALLQLRTARRRTPRMLAAAAGLLVLAGVLLSYSRGAFVALVVLAMALGAVGWVRPARLIVGAVLLAGLIAVATPSYYQRLASIGATTAMIGGRGSPRADGAIRGRTTEMLAALRAWLDHPVLGLGPGLYGDVYSAQYHRLPGIQYRHIRGTREAHSLYLELAADTGIIGFVSFLAIVAAAMAALWRMRKRAASCCPERWALATALWLSVFVYMVVGAFLHLAYERYFWFLLALAGAAVSVMERATTEGSPVPAPAPGTGGAAPPRPLLPRSSPLVTSRTAHPWPRSR